MWELNPSNNYTETEDLGSEKGNLSKAQKPIIADVFIKGISHSMVKQA